MRPLLNDTTGWTKICHTEADAIDYIGGLKPVISPLGAVAKEVKAPDGTVVGTKDRLILDPKRSLVNASASALPRWCYRATLTLWMAPSSSRLKPLTMA